jgi:hypothetical protein
MFKFKSKLQTSLIKLEKAGQPNQESGPPHFSGPRGLFFLS